MQKIAKPMLAVNAELGKIQYPAMASPKLDGVRCLMIGGKALSRKFKMIPNAHIRGIVEALAADGMDGELLLADTRAPFREVSSAVMKRSGEPDFRFGVFDWLHPNHGADEPFKDRFKRLYNHVSMMHATWEGPGVCPIFVVNHAMIENEADLLRGHKELTEAGFEGTMLRSPEGPYKFGRSTVRQGYLLKVKNFEDEEAEIIGFDELMHNDNELERDELGNAKRSSAKEGLVPAGVLGALRLRFEDGTEFGCGAGFTAAQRQWFWMRRQNVLGQTVKIKHQPDPGGRLEGQPPRFPVFLGFRDTSID